MDPFLPLMVSPERCNMPPVKRSPSFSISSSWTPFIILDKYNPPSCVMPMAAVMLEVDDLKGRSVHVRYLAYPRVPYLAGLGWLVFGHSSLKLLRHRLRHFITSVSLLLFI